MTNVYAARAATRHLRLALYSTMLLVPMALQGQTPFNRAAWQHDYATLKHALEAKYSNLAWFASPSGGVDLPALDRRTAAALLASRSDDDARDVIRAFVRGFHDGHFSELSTVGPPSRDSLPEPAAFAYSRSDPVSGCAALGYGPQDPPTFSLPFESLNGFRVLADGITTPFRIGITGDSGKAAIGVIRIPTFDEMANAAVCQKDWTHDEIWGVGRLRRGVLRQQVELDWYRTLAEAARTLKAAGATSLLIDVGNNSGGNEAGGISALIFTTRPLRSAPLWMSQDSATSAPYFEEQLDALRAAQRVAPTDQRVIDAIADFTRGAAALGLRACAMDWVWRERKSWTDATQCRRLVAAGSAGGPLAYLAPDSTVSATVARALYWPTLASSSWGAWAGPLFVLTDRRTYSSAEMFAAVLQNNGAGKTVGTTTGGDGCGFMSDPDPVVLPHSRLRFRVPNCVRIRADGGSEVAGVKADIPIVPTEGESARTRAMRVIVAIRAAK